MQRQSRKQSLGKEKVRPALTRGRWGLGVRVWGGKGWAMIRQNPFRKESARVVRANIRDEIIAPRGGQEQAVVSGFPACPMDVQLTYLSTVDVVWSDEVRAILT